MAQNHSTETSGDLAINITSFKRHLLASNKSPKTIKTYVKACTQLARFVKKKGMPRDLRDLRREHVEHYRDDQLERWTPSTAANRFGGLRAFFKWAVEGGEIQPDSNPLANMRSPRVPENQVWVVSAEEISGLLRACQGTGFEERRDRAILRLFVTTGEEARDFESPFVRGGVKMYRCAGPISGQARPGEARKDHRSPTIADGQQVAVEPIHPPRVILRQPSKRHADVCLWAGLH